MSNNQAFVGHVERSHFRVHYHFRKFIEQHIFLFTRNNTIQKGWDQPYQTSITVAMYWAVTGFKVIKQALYSVEMAIPKAIQYTNAYKQFKIRLSQFSKN